MPFKWVQAGVKAVGWIQSVIIDFRFFAMANRILGGPGRSAVDVTYDGKHLH